MTLFEMIGWGLAYGMAGVVMITLPIFVLYMIIVGISWLWSL